MKSHLLPQPLQVKLKFTTSPAMSSAPQLTLRWLYTTASSLRQGVPVRLLLAAFPRWMTMARSPSKTDPILILGSPTSYGRPPDPYTSTVFASIFLILAPIVMSFYLLHWRTLGSCRSSTSESTSNAFLEHEISISETTIVYRLTEVVRRLEFGRVYKVGLIAAWLAYGLVSVLSQLTSPVSIPLLARRFFSRPSLLRRT